MADDDEDDCYFFREALDTIHFSCNFFSVNNGEKLIEFFHNSVTLPDYVFLDINMPRLNGIECLKYIRKHYPDPGIRIIMLSTTAGHQTVDQCSRNGADLYIQKPGKFAELAKYLEYCLTSHVSQADRQVFMLNELLKKL